MCAIFGIIGKSDTELLRKMSKCQLYRGPDKQNFFIDKKFKLSLGMNRLSVIDKKKGNQPMFSHDRRHVIVFNGTIYNFKDLKKYLENKINFYTDSDTEVLILLIIGVENVLIILMECGLLLYMISKQRLQRCLEIM